jgi:HEAT repeat protein
MSEDVVFFTFDPLPEVRASAARALGSSKSIVALNALTHLLQDPEWFVRLRAAAALGEVNDPRAIPALIAALCDENRLVRLRTAEVLSRFESDLPEILRTVMETKDEYALQAFVAQAERAGTVPRLIDSLGHPGQEGRARAALGDLLQSGAHRMLLDGLTRHPQRRVRDAIARLLADKPDRRLVSELGALLPSQAPRQWRFAVGSARRESNGQHGASDGSKTVFV